MRLKVNEKHENMIVPSLMSMERWGNTKFSNNDFGHIGDVSTSGVVLKNNLPLPIPSSWLKYFKNIVQLLNIELSIYFLVSLK